MRRLTLVLCVLSAMLLTGAVCNAEDRGPFFENIDGLMEGLLQSQILSLRCDVPNIQPKLTNLRRSWSPIKQELQSKFIGDDPSALLGEQSVTSPLWGEGTRIKSGTVIHIADTSNTTTMTNTKAIEVIPTFLDLYSTGFIYANNIPHKAVYATNVDITDKAGRNINLSELDPEDEASTEDIYNVDVSYSYVFDVDDGKAAALGIVKQLLGDVTVGSDFRLSEYALVQDFGERLFAYRAWPEYLTEYNIYENTGVILGPDADANQVNTEAKVLGTRPVAVPVHDVYVHMLVDGDKLLAGLEYFWDSNLEVDGTPKECLHAGTALASAPKLLFDHFNGEPPLLTVNNISLGYVQDRTNRRTLVPVWLFDAWYSQTVEQEDSGSGTAAMGGNRFAKNVVSVPMPFAINALTGELNIL